MTQAPGCYSGGRYCALSGVHNDPEKANLVLKETVKEICLNRILEEDEDYKSNAELVREIKSNYYSNWNEFCPIPQENMHDCIFNFLESKETKATKFHKNPDIGELLTAKIGKCWYESWNSFLTDVPRLNSAKSDNIIEVNPWLNDNKLLSKELADFKQISGYEHFPLLKINGMNYNGTLNMYDVKMYLCKEILEDADCNERSWLRA